MKVFHLTYWYCSAKNPTEGVWIKNHIASLASHVERQHVCHFEVKNSRHFSFTTGRLDANHSSFRLEGPFPWRLIELMSFIAVAFLLLTKARKYSLINVHIAYPLLTHFHWIRKVIKKPVVITEHWSAYHFNFGVRERLPRIERIFANQLPLICVSECLLSDLRNFSHQALKNSCVVPNGVDVRIFNRKAATPRADRRFFMLSNWKWPKRPDVVISAFGKLIEGNADQHYELRIGGSGVQIREMATLVDSLNLGTTVCFLGRLSPERVAIEMNECDAFLHASDYETFSVVCAEAICCGAPVIASAVGGIPEFIHPGNGILVDDNSIKNWYSALECIQNFKFDSNEISRAGQAMFSLERVGIAYAGFLKKICAASS